MLSSGLGILSRGQSADKRPALPTSFFVVRKPSPFDGAAERVGELRRHQAPATCRDLSASLPGIVSGGPGGSRAPIVRTYQAISVGSKGTVSEEWHEPAQASCRDEKGNEEEWVLQLRTQHQREEGDHGEHEKVGQALTTPGWPRIETVLERFQFVQELGSPRVSGGIPLVCIVHRITHSGGWSSPLNCATIERTHERVVPPFRTQARGASTSPAP